MFHSFKRYALFLLLLFYLVNPISNSEHLTYANTVANFSFTKEEMNQIEQVIKGCGNGVSVFYQDITSGYSYTYNADQKYFIASIIKAPYCMYIYKLSSEGKCDLDKRYTYASRHQSGGTGKIQFMKVGTSFSMRELLEYAIKYSDNVAMNMIKEAYPVDGYKKYAKTLGLTHFEDIKNATNGLLTAKDAGIYIHAIYQFINENPNGKELKTLMSSTSNPMITSKYPVIRKYGWAEQSFHDIAIVDAPRPYLLCILTNHDGDFTSFKKISTIIEKISQESYCKTAIPSPNCILYSGSNTPICSYEINGSTYVSIRELEALLKGTNSSIQIQWHTDSHTLSISKASTPSDIHIPHTDTTPLKKLPSNKPLEAIKKDYKVLCENTPLHTDVYQIDENTYLKLRDICEALDLNINLDLDKHLIELFI